MSEPTIKPNENLALPIELRQYQQEGVRFLLEQGSGLLADEMGLGKTVQAAVALSVKLKKATRRRSLVIVPASLRLNWKRELGKWAPDLSVGMVQGGSDDRQAYYKLPFNVLIASYEQIRSDLLHSTDTPEFDVVILDEAQRIKNPNSETALACRVVRRETSWALTGTPLENQVGDLVSVYRFLRPGLLSVAMTRSEMHAVMQPYFLRRRKKEVLPQLPPIQYQDIPLELDGHQKTEYDLLWEERSSVSSEKQGQSYSSSMLALITRLKLMCNFDQLSGESSKLEALNLIIEGLVSPEHKLLVFSQYVKTLEWIAQEIGDGMSVDILHGGLKEDEKDALVEEFNNEVGPRVLLISLKAGGVGLNLGTASDVVLFDRWWNPAVEEQAIHRAHRFGRDSVLHVHRFLVVDSIEERIESILGEKREIFDQYVESADNATVSAYDSSDLERLLDLIPA